MPVNSRAKGHAGERAVATILRDELGIEVQRNLEQWRSGGTDLIGIEGWAIEVKRAKKPLLKQWWEQTVDQAQRINSMPVLWYRLDRQDWRVRVPMWVLNPDFPLDTDLTWTAELSPAGFCMLVRERM